MNNEILLRLQHHSRLRHAAAKIKKIPAAVPSPVKVKPVKKPAIKKTIREKKVKIKKQTVSDKVQCRFSEHAKKYLKLLNPGITGIVIEADRTRDIVTVLWDGQKKVNKYHQSYIEFSNHKP